MSNPSFEQQTELLETLQQFLVHYDSCPDCQAEIDITLTASYVDFALKEGGFDELQTAKELVLAAATGAILNDLE